MSQKKVPEILLVNDEIDHGNTTDMMQSEDVIDKQVYKVSTLYPFDISVNDGISKKSVTVNFDTINADNVTKWVCDNGADNGADNGVPTAVVR